MATRPQYAFSELVRIVYMQACRELSDRARSQVSTYGDAYRRGGEMVAEAHALLRDAEDLVRLAVAAERAASVSWETIGEALQVSRQSAHERFAAGVEALFDDVLFPTRESADGGPGWWTPAGLSDPAETVRHLDGWARRHRETYDPDRGDHPVSERLARRPDLAAIESVGVVTRLAQRILDGKLPAGVSDRTARRILLERKLHSFEQIAAREHGATARDARAQADQVFAELVDWHRAELDDRLAVQPIADEGAQYDSYRFLLGAGPIAELWFSAEPGDPDATGWFIASIDPDAFAASPDSPARWLGDPWPVDVDGVDVIELAELGRRDGLAAVRAAAQECVARTRSAALLQARKQLIADLATDLAKGAR